MAKKNKRKEPSVSAIKNDRSIFLGNTKDYLFLGEIAARKFRGASAISDNEVIKLINLLDKGSNTLRKYLYPRPGLGNDLMLSAINDSFNNGESFTGFEHEIAWLSKFGNSYAEVCESFLNEENEIPLTSINDCYKEIIEIREEFGRTYFKPSVLPSTLLENSENLLRKALQTIGGTGLVCDDGLKYYNPNSEFSVKSIWLGFRMFFDGARNLIEMANLEEG